MEQRDPRVVDKLSSPSKGTVVVNKETSLDGDTSEKYLQLRRKRLNKEFRNYFTHMRPGRVHCIDRPPILRVSII